MRLCDGSARRGVLLLVILGLLAMFGLVAVAFVVLTGQAWRSALATKRLDQYHDPPRKLVHQAFLQVVRGSTNPASRIGPHCLLEDIYGEQPAELLADDVAAIYGGQLIEVRMADPLRRLGCVVTVATGALAGESTHVVGYNPATDRVQMAGRWNVMGPDQAPGHAGVDDDEDGMTDEPDELGFQNPGSPPIDDLLKRGDRLIINGPPFAGTGFGYGGPGEDRLNAMDTELGVPLALLPGSPDLLTPVGLGGGANEDYDAPDYQNLLLAAQVPTVDPQTGQLVVQTIPSLHRPALVNYWRSQPDWNNPDPERAKALRRRVILRPLVEDHPAFALVNPAFDPVGGPWDVDNDGDGRPDSIWVDLGMPARSTPDGRLYKPLVAVLCVDLDGRLNLNAHGNWAQAEQDYYAPPDEVFTPRGQGYGPAEVNLRPLFRDRYPPQDLEVYTRLLAGVVLPTGERLEGRYGEFDIRTSGGRPQPGATLDVPNAQEPRWANDLLSRNQHFDYPANFTDFATLTAYGTPPDLKGSLMVFLDLRGQPDYRLLGNDWTQAGTNDPYELDLACPEALRGYRYPDPADPDTSAVRTGVDSPFRVSELERLLRPFDRDASGLPARLWGLTFNSALSPPRSDLHDRRHAITTESWDLPCANAMGAGHVTEILRSKVSFPGTTQAEAYRRLRRLFPWELLAGMRMDLNRRFGNGVDEQWANPGQLGYGVVDEPAEAEAGEAVPLALDWRPQAGGDAPLDMVPMDHVNNVDVNQDGRVDGIDRAMARQLYARHLYCLMMAVMDDGYTNPDWQGLEDRAYHVAQWAVNVVDFRDRDSIMTRFAYDPAPFDQDGWSPDGTRVVFGCERPELLISETLAFHDRRTEDREDAQLDPPGDPEDEDTQTIVDNPDEHHQPDADFDQRLRPQGSLFVEVYNPWANHDPTAPGEPPPWEFYGQENQDNWGVDLAKTVTDPDTGTRSPVWRMIIVFEADRNVADGDDSRESDPDHPDPDERPQDEDIQRAVYFTQAPNLAEDAEREVFYPGGAYAAGGQILVPPGRYAVIGPGEPAASGASATHIGLRKRPVPQDQNNPAEREIDRQIVLDPTADPETEWTVNVVNNGTQGVPDKVPPAVAVVINTPRRLSVTEPKDADYYPDSDPAGTAYDPQTGYAKPYDIPLDKELQPGLWDLCLKHDGSHENFCVIHLQRLANPLQGYNAETNPYRTIDSMPVDLTTFNGVDMSGHDEKEGGQQKPRRFSTRERGEAETAEAGGPTHFNLWRHEPTWPKTDWTQPRPTAEEDDQQHVFADHLQHTFGYLNDQFGDRFPQGFPQGFPQNGRFPWLTWNNRPFISHLELLQVPAVRSSQLLARYDLSNGAENVYDPASRPAFPHLASLFPSTPSEGGSPQFHRLLEFVCVPSRFVGTTDQVNPYLRMDPADLTSPQWLEDENHWFRPPVNHIPRFREPGRINLNTVFHPDVWLGLTNYFPDMDAQTPAYWKWDAFWLSRRGYAGGGILDTPNPDFPTFFANPFRSFGGAWMVPPTTPVLDPSHELKTNIGAEINATLLRAGPGAAGGGAQPLFDYFSRDPATAAPYPYEDTNRNPYFRHQFLQRLGNLATTRSNVYAIWITVGYFEVQPLPAGYDPRVYPDGYTLGPELGSDTGEIKRHRAFYIFDRSIPVGFVRGQDLNVEKAILLKRFIE